MLVKEGIHRNDDTDQRLASILAGIAGALNAAAFYAVGFFSANMTGNVSTLSISVALGQWSAGFFYLAVVLAFILGSAASALLINAGRRRRITAIYAYGVSAEALLLAVLGGIDLWLPDLWRGPVLVLGLAFLMGLQNAVVTRISGARVRTTHVSGLATDIGIELAIAIDILRGKNHGDDAALNLSKLRLHIYTISSFLLGGIIGVFAYRALGGYMLFLSSGLLLWSALPGIARSRRGALSDLRQGRR